MTENSHSQPVDHSFSTDPDYLAFKAAAERGEFNMFPVGMIIACAGGQLRVAGRNLTELFSNKALQESSGDIYIGTISPTGELVITVKLAGS